MIPEGQVLVYGANRDNAVALLAYAEQLGYPPEVVVTQEDGFLVPQDVSDLMYPAPDPNEPVDEDDPPPEEG